MARNTYLLPLKEIIPLRNRNTIAIEDREGDVPFVNKEPLNASVRTDQKYDKGEENDGEGWRRNLSEAARGPFFEGGRWRSEVWVCVLSFTRYIQWRRSGNARNTEGVGGKSKVPLESLLENDV